MLCSWWPVSQGKERLGKAKEEPARKPCPWAKHFHATSLVSGVLDSINGDVPNYLVGSNPVDGFNILSRDSASLTGQ